jgi:1-acyl-sn-glycerol-3-phosphate acyltransferase
MFLPGLIRVPLVMLLIAASTVLHTTPLFLVALLRWLLPIAPVRRFLAGILVGLAESWIAFNAFLVRHATPTRLRMDGHYLVLANHQSWVDIIMLQTVLNRRAPFMRFFLKSQLIWVPLLGLAWWALEFPFMKRHTSAYLAQHPEARGQDLAATRKACERFATIPTSVMNFVEGTRYTPAKHAALKSPYRHLLPPRAGGVAFVLSAMGRMLHSMLDVTIAYREASPSLWDLCCGRLDTVRVDVQKRPIERWMTEGDYSEDPDFRARFQAWLGEAWADKDRRLDAMAVAA